MATQLAVRFSDEEIAVLDELVQAGKADNRSAAVRFALEYLSEVRRLQRVAERDKAVYEAQPQLESEHAWSTAAAIAMIDAEDWSEWYPPSVGGA